MRKQILALAFAALAPCFAHAQDDAFERLRGASKSSAAPRVSTPSTPAKSGGYETVVVDRESKEPRTFQHDFALGVSKLPTSFVASVLAYIEGYTTREKLDIQVEIYSTADSIPVYHGKTENHSDLQNAALGLARNTGIVGAIEHAGVPFDNISVRTAAPTPKGERYLKVAVYPEGKEELSVRVPTPAPVAAARPSQRDTTVIIREGKDGWQLQGMELGLRALVGNFTMPGVTSLAAIASYGPRLASERMYFSPRGLAGWADETMLGLEVATGFTLGRKWDLGAILGTLGWKPSVQGDESWILHFDAQQRGYGGPTLGFRPTERLTIEGNYSLGFGETTRGDGRRKFGGRMGHVALIYTF